MRCYCINGEGACTYGFWDFNFTQNLQKNSSFLKIVVLVLRGILYRKYEFKGAVEVQILCQGHFRSELFLISSEFKGAIT